MIEHKSAPVFSLRRHCWDEENRLTDVADDKRGSMFYDASGERAIKLAGNNEWVNINGVPQGFGDMTAGTLYTSQYLVASGQGYTKHYYADDQRIVSKLGGGNILNLDFRPDDVNKYRESKQKNLQDMFVRTKECLGAKILGVGHYGSWIDRFSEYKLLQKAEKEIYFYHPDHLGSSSWITDASGKPIQHLSYLPFGEEFVDQQISDWSAVYKFSGKKKDAETSYNYFGARYYWSDGGIWLSVDPCSDKYPYQTLYSYCANNLMKLVDPDGRNFTNFKDADGNLVKHVDDGSNAVFRQTGSGTGKHYTFTGYDESQGGANEVNLETAIQEQQQLNNDNPSLQQNGNTTYCTYATQNVMKKR